MSITPRNQIFNQIQYNAGCYVSHDEGSVKQKITAVSKGISKGHADEDFVLLNKNFVIIENHFLLENSRCKHGLTALMRAAKSGNIEEVEALLRKDGINVNATDKDGNSALMLAAKAGYHEVVNRLLRNNSIDIFCENAEGENALMLAAKNGYIEIVTVLFDKSYCMVIDNQAISINNKINTPYMMFYDKNRKLHASLGTNIYSENALMLAAKNDHSRVVKVLLRNCCTNVDASCGEWVKISEETIICPTALILAANRGNLKVVQLLLNYYNRLDPNYSDLEYQIDDAMMLADQNGHTAVFKELSLYC